MTKPTRKMRTEDGWIHDEWPQTCTRYGCVPVEPEPSRSVQRRVAVQKGEPTPAFEPKPKHDWSANTGDKPWTCKLCFFYTANRRHIENGYCRHLWVQRQWPVCERCGVVQNKTNIEKPCIGVVRIETRSEEPMPTFEPQEPLSDKDECRVDVLHPTGKSCCMGTEGCVTRHEFPTCPSCGKTVTVSWEDHEEDCVPEPQELTELCADCHHPKDDPKMHLDSSGENWSSALHWFRAAEPQPEMPQLVIGKPCPTCGREVRPPFGPGDYSCAACGFGMVEPCEHWKNAEGGTEEIEESAEFIRGRLFQFRRMKLERPIDATYWDMHEERSLTEPHTAENCSMCGTQFPEGYSFSWFYDRVRQQRHELHEAGLITDSEFVELAASTGSVERLEAADLRKPGIEQRAIPEAELQRVAEEIAEDAVFGQAQSENHRQTLLRLKSQKYLAILRTLEKKA